MSSAASRESTIDSGRLAKLRELLWADPGNEALWSRCASLAVELRDYSALQELARTKLALTPEHREALFHLATASLGAKRPGEAIAPLETLLQSMPDEAAVLSNLALCQYAAGNFAEAVRHLEHSYGLGRREPDLLRLLVSSYHHVDRIEDAVKVAAENLEAARNDPVLAGVFALAFLDDDDAVRAHRCALWCLEDNPRSIDGLVVEGTLDLGRLETAAAESRFNAVIEQAPKNGRAWIGLGTSALLRGQIEQAKAAIRQGLEHMPGHVGSWHLLAWAELVTGQIDEAQRLFEHALELDRNFAETHGGIASIAAIRGDRDTATKEIAIANRLDPDCLSAKFAESILKGAANDVAGAQALMSTTITTLAEQNSGPLAALLASLARH